MSTSDSSADARPDDLSAPLSVAVPDFKIRGERRSVDSLCDDTSSSRPRLLHRRFEQQAATAPLAEALVVGQRRVTYRELNERANRIAHRLIALGVGPESLVGVYLDRTDDLIVALLGVLKAGAAYVPLDPVYPSARLSFILNDAVLSVVLTQASLHDTVHRVSAVAGVEPVCVCVDTDEQLAFALAENPSAPVLPENLAYVLYTPGYVDLKGVAIEHRNAASFIEGAGRLYGAGELSGVLACTSVCFDPSILEIFVPLSFGGRVILADNILALGALPAFDEIRLLDTIPSVARELLRIGGLPPSLETINLGGEPVPDRLVRQLYASSGIKRVYDQYGPIETTTIATSVLRVPGEPATLGFPLTGTRIHLLDHEGRRVPAGSIGELCIGGEGVARGYLNRPGLTADKFIPDPFSDEPGARLFRTGDLCRLRPDGRLEYIGRVDDYVQIDGRFVNLGEVESVLRSHPSVGEAVVMLREDVPGDARLVAYVAPRPLSADSPAGATPAPVVSDLARYLRARLPHHLLPLVVALLAFFTVLATGQAERASPLAPARFRTADYTANLRNSRGRDVDIRARLLRLILPRADAAVAAQDDIRTSPRGSAFLFRVCNLSWHVPAARSASAIPSRATSSGRTPSCSVPRHDLHALTIPT